MSVPNQPTIVPPPELAVLVGLATFPAAESLTVTKDGFNPHFQYAYMTEAALFAAARAALAAAGLSATISFEQGQHETITTFREVDGRTVERPAIMATVTAHLVIRDRVGVAIECKAYGQGIDPADKAYAKAMSMASKYVVQKALMIGVEGAEDTDAGEGHAVAGRRGNGDGAGTASEKQLGYLTSLVKKIRLADAAGAEQMAWRLARMNGDAAPAFASLSKRTASDLIVRLKKVEDNPEAGSVINTRLITWETDNGLSHTSDTADEPVPAGGVDPHTPQDEDVPFHHPADPMEF